jgi:DNA repair exonuclease SbcCD ATPase subunit
MSRELIATLRATEEEISPLFRRDAADLLEQQAAEIERLQRWRSTNAPRLEALEGLLHTAQHELHGAREAVATLASEREANAILTAEIEALRKDAERLRAALHRVRSVMGPTVPSCCGCATEWRMALETIDAAMSTQARAASSPDTHRAG